MRIDLNLTIDVAAETVLEALRRHREAHITIVGEARAGYLRQARTALKLRLTEVSEQIRRLETDSDEPVTLPGLNFKLRPPECRLEVYDSAISMIEAHIAAHKAKAPTTSMTIDGEARGEAVLTLDSRQYRQLVEDKWDWMADFLGVNALYSATAAALR